MHRLSRTAGHLGVAPASGARREHAPGRVPAPRASQEWQDRIYALHELIPMAKSQLTKQDWEFMRGGSDAEASIRRNRMEIDSLALRPSMLEDVSSINLSTTLFGGELAMPIISAPMGGMGRWDPADVNERRSWSDERGLQSLQMLAMLAAVSNVTAGNAALQAKWEAAYATLTNATNQYLARPDFAELWFSSNAAHFTATASTLMLAYCSALCRQATCSRKST